MNGGIHDRGPGFRRQDKPVPPLPPLEEGRSGMTGCAIAIVAALVVLGFVIGNCGFL